MARKLNTRLLVSVAIFIGVPVALLAAYLIFFVRSGDPQKLFAEAQQLYEEKEYGQAWMAIRNCMKAGGGKDPEAHFLMAEIALKQTPPAVLPAINALRATLEMKADHVEAQRLLAEVYLGVRYWKEAKEQIDKLIKLDPNYGKAYLWGGFVEMALGDAEPNVTRRQPFYTAAAARCRTGIEKAPDQMDLYRLLAQVHEKMGQKDKVDEVLNLAIANNPQSAESYILKASRQVSQNQLKAAGDTLKKAIGTGAPAPRLYVMLGEVAMRQNEPDAAKEYFSKAVEVAPKDEAAYLRLSGLYRMENDRAAAVGILEKGLAALPAAVPLLAELADVHLELADAAKADDVLARIEKANPKAPVLSYLRGKRALMRHQVWQAIEFLEKMPDRKSIPQARLLLGRAYLVADELGAARAELEGLVADQPGLVAGWRTLAEVQHRLRDYERAAQSAKRVLDSNANDRDMRLLLARTLAAQNRYTDALREAQAAARLRPDPEPELLMAAIYTQMNRPSDAEAAYRRALATGKDLSRVYPMLLRYYRDTKQPAKEAALLEEAKKSLPPDEYMPLVSTPEEVEKDLTGRYEKGSASLRDMLSLARLAQLTDRNERAVEVLDKVLTQAKPGSDEWRQAWQQLFLIALAGDAYDRATDLAERLKAVDPTAPELLFSDALIALKQNKVVEATQILTAVSQAHRSNSQAHYLLGQVLLRQKKGEEAMAALRLALETRPNLLPARILLARLLSGQGNYAAALEEANAALRYDARLVPALEYKAIAHAGQGQWEAALAAREEIARLVPDNVQNLIALAALHLQRHTPQKADEIFARAYKLAPDNALLVRAYADFLNETARPRQGEQIVDDYVSRHKDLANAWVVRGEFAANAGGPAEAEKYFRKAAELAPDEPYPLIFLGDQYSKIGDWAKAAAVYLEAVQRTKNEKDTTARKRLADVYMLQNKLADAQAVADAVLKQSPQDAAAMVVAGRIAARQDKVDLARQYMEQALKLQPDYGEAKVRLAELYAAPNPEKALDLLNKVEPTDPSFEKAMLLRADINTRRVQLAEAIMDLRRLLEFRPTSVPGRMALAARYMIKPEPARATEIYAQLSRERMDKDPQLLIALGDAQMREEKYRDALASYEKARSLLPDSADALTGEARCLVALNRTQEAEARIYKVMDVYYQEVWPRMALVAVYERTGRMDKAFESLRNGLLRRGDWESGYVYLADLLMKSKQIEDARQVLNTGLAKLPKSVPIRAGLAAIEIGAGRPEAATNILKSLAEEFETQYGLSPEKVDRLRQYMAPVRIYSLALYNLGKAQESLKWGMLLWGIDPTDVANANNMAWILATEEGKIDQARDMIDRCKRLVPNHPQVLDTSGWIHFLGKRYEEAREDLLASVKYGDNAEAHYHLGRLYEALGRIEEARAEYKKAVDMGLRGKERDDVLKRTKDLAAPAK